MDDNQYEIAKRDFLFRIEITSEEKDKIEQDTILQSASPLWLETRRKLLTASWFSSMRIECFHYLDQKGGEGEAGGTARLAASLQSEFSEIGAATSCLHNERHQREDVRRGSMALAIRARGHSKQRVVRSSRVVLMRDSQR
ncbi:unnamed protein product [Colias eurytheme]|nr:unnamed protein product [Colias eurytheme]